MLFPRPLLGCTRLDLQRNVDVKETLKVQSVVEETQSYQKNWKEHVERMQYKRLPKLAFKCKPAGKRSRGCPRKRWKWVEECGPNKSN
jgi:hypothetical protein